MTLKEHFETSGQWLFRKRSYLPVLLFAVILFGLRDFQYHAGEPAAQTAWELVCFAVGLSGLVVRSIAIGYAALGTSGRITSGQEADALNTTGMYSMVRHPLYLGNYLMWISAALLTRTVWVPLVISLIFWLYYERIMMAEEAFLREKFGAQFDRWAAETRAFVPGGHWRSPHCAFAVRRVLRRERSGLLGLVLYFAAFDLLVRSRARDAFYVHPFWLIASILALLLYAVLEVEKKRARR